MMTSAVGEVVEVFDEHPDDLERVRHGDGQVSACQTSSWTAGPGGELGQPHVGEDGQECL